MIESMASLPIRLVAIDLDGTLLNDAKQACERAVAALAGLSDVKTVIASARPPRSVRHVYRQLRLDTLQINYNGCLIWHEPTRTALFHNPLPGSLVKPIVQAAQRFDAEVIVTAEVLDRCFTDRVDDALGTETAKLFPADVVAPAHTFWEQETTKLMLATPPGRIAALEAELHRIFEGQITVVQTDPHLLQLMHPSNSKGAALARVAEHYGVSMEQVLAIGDARNDIPMLQAAGVGVAMDNAHPLTKAVADWIAPSNNDHGVHAALVRYGVCSE